MQLSLQHSKVYQLGKLGGKRFPNFPVRFWCCMFQFVSLPLKTAQRVGAAVLRSNARRRMRT
jgi:hypothetical protein